MDLTPSERVDLAVRLFNMNAAMRDLRENVDQAASLAKSVDANDLAFATYLLSESIGTYMDAVNRYVVRELGTQ